jgi:hypothetical protein
MKPGQMGGYDSLVGRYRSQSIALTYDYGAYSDSLNYSDHSSFTEKTETIDGKNAKVASFYSAAFGQSSPHVIAVHFPMVSGKETKLTISAACRATNDFETAIIIFRTIKFK